MVSCRWVQVLSALMILSAAVRGQVGGATVGALPRNGVDKNLFGLWDGPWNITDVINEGLALSPWHYDEIAHAVVLFHAGEFAVVPGLHPVPGTAGVRRVGTERSRSVVAGGDGNAAHGLPTSRAHPRTTTAPSVPDGRSTTWPRR